MNYIVLDLEWNQGENEEGNLPFEIIEIGAVKVNENGEIIDKFSMLIRPSIYPEIYKYISKVIGVGHDELRKGSTFVDAFYKFIEWCGKDVIFCTWGPMDLTELQRNMDYYHIENPFPFPFYYYDIQKIYSIHKKEGKIKRALDYVVEEMGITVDGPFHRAMWDSYYTAKVMEKIPLSKYLIYESIDYHRIPQTRKDEIYKVFHNYSKYVSREFSSKEEAMKEKSVTSSVCFLCGKSIKKKVDWFSVSGKFYYCAAWCPIHGWMKGKIRVKKGKNRNTIFVIKTMKYTNEEEIGKIKEKQIELREKRKERRKLLKEGI